MRTFTAVIERESLVREPADVKPRLKSAVPQFTVPDVVQTAEYYRDTLGFDIAGYWATPPQFGDELAISENESHDDLAAAAAEEAVHR